MTRDGRLWTAVLGAPTIWFASLLANFALSPWACARGWKPVLFAVALAALVLTAAAGWLAWGIWRQTGLEPPGESGGATARTRSLALAGVLLCAMFFLVILAQSIPNIILGACE